MPYGITARLNERMFAESRPKLSPIFTTSPEMNHNRSNARQEVLQDLQEQVGQLTALLQDERRSHQHCYRALLDEAEHNAEKGRHHHQLEMEQLMQAHRSEMSNLVAAHSRALEDERKSAKERYVLLKKDYDFLKCSFRPYKDSQFDNSCSKSKEEHERFLKKHLLWLKEQLNQSEAEKVIQRKASESEIAELHGRLKAEVEDLKRQLKEKDMTISLLRATLHQSQEEQYDVPTFRAGNSTAPHTSGSQSEGPDPP